MSSYLTLDCFPYKVFYWVFSFVFPWFYCQVKLCAQYFLVNVCPPQPLESSPHQKVRSVLTLPSVIENLLPNIEIKKKNYQHCLPLTPLTPPIAVCWVYLFLTLKSFLCVFYVVIFLSYWFLQVYPLTCGGYFAKIVQMLPTNWNNSGKISEF